ncbi:hypothetical protein [Halopiger aswanensis]|uniref:Uncharacterized protein n=1 Tax=Halopiger aswanensis TaxID=148449 RepID=A0A3R7DCP9_9EURY|nr:hypothetical protein [Halopiger aswanensis]RKD98180.1 hypothetical protein ATJ93_1185 [Halopiger aswanensis]
MALIVDAADDRSEVDSRREGTVTTAERRRRIDVTDLRTAGIEEFVRANVSTERVSLEHCGARTYLVLEE